MTMDELLRSVLLLSGRLCLSVVFLVSALDKAWHFGAALDEFREARLPYPHLFVVLTVVFHAVAALCLIAGAYTRIAAASLAVFVVVATLRVHRFWRLERQERVDVGRIALANLAVVGGLLVLAAAGPGSIAM